MVPEAAEEYDEVTVRAATGEFYSMRTIRAYHGTKLYMEKERLEKEGKPPPFNYLQHTKWSMTLAHYYD